MIDLEGFIGRTKINVHQLDLIVNPKALYRAYKKIMTNKKFSADVS